MSSLKNKNIIVTGASGGIGNSIVEKLSQNGANILATGTRIEKLEELKKKFNNIKILKFDISQHDKIEEFIENATKELGGSLDCIVNNAGVTNFIEIGPGKVLSGLIKRIDRNVKVSAINSEEDIKLININE